MTLKEPAQTYLRHAINTQIGVDPARSRWLIYAHYDIDQSLGGHVSHFLKVAYQAGFNILFVTTVPELQPSALEFLHQHVSQIIFAENRGRDLLSYRVGFTQLNLEAVDELLIANDTVIGPIGSLQTFLDFADRATADVVGYCDSYEIRYHLQSYFFLIKASALAKAAVQDFFSTFVFQPDLNSLIKTYEVGMQELFEAEGLTTAAYVSQFADQDFYFLKAEDAAPGRKRKPANPSRDRWLDLVQKGDFSLLKYRWIRDAWPIENLDWRWLAEVKRAGYDLDLIIPYIRRTRGRYHKPKKFTDQVDPTKATKVRA